MDPRDTKIGQTLFFKKRNIASVTFTISAQQLVVPFSHIKNCSVLLMLILPPVWCSYQPSIFICILLITSETKKPPACTMYALAHRLYEYYYATNSYKVLQAIFLDYYATHENAASSSAQGRKIYMIPNYLHSKVLALFCSILCKICPYYTFIEEKL